MALSSSAERQANIERSPQGLSDVSIRDASDDTLEGWLVVHNVLIPNAPLTMEDARDRLTRHRLLVAVCNDEVVGSTTVRPPMSDSAGVMVIARVLPAHQGRGIGTALYERASSRRRSTDRRAS